MSTMPAVFSKMIGDKRRWRQYKARTRQLPDNYRTAIDAVERLEFIETFVQNYPEGHWISRQRERLNNAIERAADEDTGNEERTVR